MMYFGNTRRELVNNHVQSEGKNEFRRTLMLTAGRDLSLVAPPVETQGRNDVLRSDRLRIQCPKCRRATALQA